jgi:hypothetical protein
MPVPPTKEIFDTERRMKNGTGVGRCMVCKMRNPIHHYTQSHTLQLHPSNLERRDGNSNSLAITMADANIDVLDTGVLGSGSGCTM